MQDTQREEKERLEKGGRRRRVGKIWDSCILVWAGLGEAPSRGNRRVSLAHWLVRPSCLFCSAPHPRPSPPTARVPPTLLISSAPSIPVLTRRLGRSGEQAQRVSLACHTRLPAAGTAAASGRCHARRSHAEARHTRVLRAGAGLCKQLGGVAVGRQSTLVL